MDAVNTPGPTDKQRERDETNTKDLWPQQSVKNHSRLQSCYPDGHSRQHQSNWINSDKEKFSFGTFVHPSLDEQLRLHTELRRTVLSDRVWLGADSSLLHFWMWLEPRQGRSVWMQVKCWASLCYLGHSGSEELRLVKCPTIQTLLRPQLACVDGDVFSKQLPLRFYIPRSVE